MEQGQQSLQAKLETIIFGTTTPAGRAFDIALLVVILISVTVVMFDSIESVHSVWGRFQLG